MNASGDAIARQATRAVESTSNVGREAALNEVSSPKSSIGSAPSIMKLVQLAVNGPKSARDQALIQKLIREHKTIAEREELRKRLAPKIGALVQESMASEVLRLLTEADAGVAPDGIFSADLFASSIPMLTDNIASANSPTTTIASIKPDPADDVVNLEQRIKQERISPPVLDQAEFLPIYPVREPSAGMEVTNFDYLTASNKLLEITIESEEIKGQLQVLDRQIAKCLEMRMRLLRRQQTMDAERLSLVTVSKAPGGPTEQPQRQQQQQQAQQQQMQQRQLQEQQQPPNFDASSSSLDYLLLEKYILPSAVVTKEKLESAKRKEVISKLTKQKSGRAKRKQVVSKRKVKKSSSKTAKKKVKPGAAEKTTVLSKPATNISATEPVESIHGPETESLLTLVKQTSPPPSSFQEEIELLDVIPAIPTTVALEKPNFVFQIEVPRVAFRLPSQHWSSSVTAASPTVSTAQALPQPPPPPMMSGQVTKAPATSSTTHAFVKLDSDKDGDAAKRKVSPASLLQNDESSCVKKTKVEQPPSKHLCFEGQPRRVHFFAHRKAVTILKVHENYVFSCSVDGTIKRYSPVKQEGYSIGQLQLGYDHQYIHNSQDVCGLEVFVTKQATYIIVGTRDGILKKFTFDSKWPLLTVALKAMLTCLTLRWNTLFAGTTDGQVLRFSAMKLQFESALRCSDHPVTCLGTAMEGACRILISGSHGGDLNVRDALTGLFNRWLKLRPNRYPIDLVVVQDRVYTLAAIREGSNEIYVHNVQDGSLLHFIEDRSVASITSFFVAATDPDNVFFTASNKFVYKYRCNGGQPQKLHCGLTEGQPSVLYLHNNMIIVGSHQGHLQALVYEDKQKTT